MNRIESIPATRKIEVGQQEKPTIKLVTQTPSNLDSQESNLSLNCLPVTCAPRCGPAICPPRGR